MNLCKLKGKMAEKNYPYKKMAQKQGYSVQTLYNRLNGRTRICTDEIDIFIRELNISDDNEKMQIFLNKPLQNCNGQ